MTERPIHFDARDIAGRMGTRPDGSPQHRQEPSQQDIGRFAQAMGSNEAAPARAASPAADAGQVAASPFCLFAQRGTAPLTNAQAPDPQAQAATAQRLEALREDMGRLVGRLMVGEESSSSGGRSLRMDISDDLLPGVTVNVFEDAGAWVAEFRCREEPSFVVLAEPAESMASRLAQTLGSDAVWRVIAEGFSLDSPAQRLTNNTVDGLPCCEAFASAPPSNR